MNRARFPRDIQRTRRRYASLCYRFQEARLRWAQLFAAFQERCRRYRLPVPPFEFSGFPLYGVTAGPAGALRLVPREFHGGRPQVDRYEPIAGGAQTLLRCWTEAAEGTIVLHAEGEVDLMTAPMLGDAIEASYRAAPRVVVDLGSLRYLDGSGVRVLENASRAHRARFVVVGSTREIHRVFEVLGLTSVLPVVHSLEAAREYFGMQ